MEHGFLAEKVSMKDHVHLTYPPPTQFPVVLRRDRPEGVNKFEEIAKICGALHVVQMASTPGSCVPCKANPFSFLCSCKGARKSGMCAHILLVASTRR